MESYLEFDELAFHKPEDQARLAGAHIPEKNLASQTQQRKQARISIAELRIAVRDRKYFGWGGGLNSSTLSQGTPKKRWSASGHQPIGEHRTATVALTRLVDQKSRLNGPPAAAGPRIRYYGIRGFGMLDCLPAWRCDSCCRRRWPPSIWYRRNNEPPE